jgi:hypothetical protein
VYVSYRTQLWCVKISVRVCVCVKDVVLLLFSVSPGFSSLNNAAEMIAYLGGTIIHMTVYVPDRFRTGHHLYSTVSYHRVP